MQSEKSIEVYLRDQLKKIGGACYKFASPGNAGVPDRLCALPGGRLVFVELKRADGILSRVQCAQFQKLRKLQQTIWIIRSKEEVDDFIRHYAGPRAEQTGESRSRNEHEN
jgi:hypothetical protein